MRKKPNFPTVRVYIRSYGESWGTPVWEAPYGSAEARRAVLYALDKVQDSSDADEMRVTLSNYRGRVV